MTGLVEFLLARIAEDEATIPCEWGCHERAYRACGAMRQIVERERETLVRYPGDAYARYNLRDLARIYADHPDCRDEWKL